MKKYILTIVLSLLVGFCLSKMMLNQYQDKSPLKPVFGQSQDVFLIQQGVYSSIETMKENTKSLSYYVYNQYESKYYVYVGITLDSNNANKISEFYKKNGINTIIKTTSMSNKSFLTELEAYDTLLKETTDEDTIKEIINKILKKYEGS